MVMAEHPFSGVNKILIHTYQPVPGGPEIRRRKPSCFRDEIHVLLRTRRVHIPGTPPPKQLYCNCNSLWIKVQYFKRFGIDHTGIGLVDIYRYKTISFLPALIDYDDHAVTHFLFDMGIGQCMKCERPIWTFTKLETKVMWQKALKTYGAFLRFEEAQ